MALWLKRASLATISTTHLIQVEVEVSVFFYSNSFNYTYLTRMRFTSSARHAGMTFGELVAQAVTSDEYELIKFAFSCMRFVSWCIQAPCSRTKDF